MADAGGAVATPGQGAPAAGVQPGAPGQGGAQGTPTAGTATGQQPQGSFNWDLFPDVPETQRELLEPHLRGVQGHVTKVEQQYAPYKSLVDTIGPDQVSNVVGFLNSYNTDPVATFLGMAQELQQAGTIPGTVSMESLQQLISGQQLAQQEAPSGQEDMPDWARQMQQQHEQQQARLAQQEQAEATARTEAENQQVLDQAKADILSQLSQAGIEDGIVGDEIIVAAIIASEGDAQAAGQLITGLRDTFLASFTKQQTGAAPKPPNVQGKLPQPPKTGRRRGDGFDDARTGARAMLETQRQGAAQS